MKRALTALSLLLILAAVSAGSPGMSYADPPAQDGAYQIDPSMIPSVGDPVAADGGSVECYGDPDDAITGNRNTGATEPPPEFSELSGAGPGDAGYDALWEMWMAMLQLYLGLN